MRANLVLVPVLVLVAIVPSAGCDPSAEKVDALTQRVDALEAKLATEPSAGDVQAKDPAVDLVKRLDALEARIEEARSNRDADKTNIDVVAQELAAIQASVRKLEEGGGGIGKTEIAGGPEGAGEIGIPECDDYIATYRVCIEDKLPEAARESATRTLATTTAAWKKAAKTPAGRTALAEACKTASEAVASMCGA